MSSHTDDSDIEPTTRSVSLTVNGRRVEATVDPRLKLADFLREQADQHGVRLGCEQGICGACTVLMDGKPLKSCLTYAVQADGAEIQTVEGLADEGLHPIQEAFNEEHGMQCGFCTSGFVMATKALLEKTTDPTREEIETGLTGNVCRCTGYQNIYNAVERAAEKMSDQ